MLLILRTPLCCPRDVIRRAYQQPCMLRYLIKALDWSYETLIREGNFFGDCIHIGQ